MKNMKVVSGEPQSGKTTLLINEAIKDVNHVIVVRDKQRLVYLENRILEKFNIKANIITYPVFRNDYFGKGRGPSDTKSKNFYIEDFDNIIERAFPNCNISMINFTSDQHLLPVMFTKTESRAFYNQTLVRSNINLCNYNGLLISENSKLTQKNKILSEHNFQLMKQISNQNKPSLFTAVKYFFLVKFKKVLCSGYGVYPNGVRCPGCSDCKNVKR